MASTQVNSYPYGADGAKKKLVTAVRGHKLLKDKRTKLMRQYLDPAKVNMEVRKEKLVSVWPIRTSSSQKPECRRRP